MSITSALNSALTGLTATSRQAEIVSTNVANASTPGYAKRTVMLSSLSLGGSGQGVLVTGVRRDIDSALINDRLLATALTGQNKTRADFLATLETIIGTREATGSLSARVDAFDTALISAASNPESEGRLSAAVNAAKDLANGLVTASNRVQEERSRADQGIAAAVEDLNAALKRVQDLNATIVSFTGAGRDVSSFLDQRQQVIDHISQIIPIKQIEDDKNRVILMSAGGAMLVEGKAAVFSFDPAGKIVPEMTLQGGALSGLSLNGKPIETTGNTSLIRGGRLSALFEVRDDLAVQGQAKLDAMARDLSERFSAAGLDPTLSAGDPGLFTDSGTAFDPANELGFAARIQVNAAVLPAQGGRVTALRDGLGANALGPAGDAHLLIALSSALTATRPTSSSAMGQGNRSLSGFASDILSLIATDRIYAEGEQAFSQARTWALQDLEAAKGVNIDEEMQAMLVIEKNYAANARILQAADEMLKVLLGL